MPAQVLPPILGRIGDSKTSDRGLEELYTLKKENPGVDLAPILGRLSTTFHSFVEKGLQRLERRDAGTLCQHPPCQDLVSESLLKDGLPHAQAIMFNQQS